MEDTSRRAGVRPYGRKLDLERGCVDMTHGAGGKNMHQLIDELLVAEDAHAALKEKADYARLSVRTGERLVVTTDGHVVSPLFFPGGDIGRLAICGTINDLAMAGAEPLCLTVGLILEEGFALRDLSRIAASLRETQHHTGVPVVAGDTKVVERGKADGVFITTTGVGAIRDPRVDVSLARVALGDEILINGFVGDHGVAIMSKREHLAFETELVSDVAPLHELVRTVLCVRPDVHFMRDPTRGGVAGTLNEVAHGTGLTLELDEAAIPVRPQVSAACELLGLDPLNVANEGKFLLFCAPDATAEVLAALRSHALGRDARAIGKVVGRERPLVQIRSRFGGVRALHWLAGEELPRIC